MSKRRHGLRAGALLLTVVAWGAVGAVASCGASDEKPVPPPDVLSFRVTDKETGRPLPAKVVLQDTNRNVIPFGTRDMYDGSEQDLGFCDLGRGVLGTAEGLVLQDGTGDLPVNGGDSCTPTPAVVYGLVHVVIFHGIEFESFETDVQLVAGMGHVTVDAPLQRAWTPTGALSADLHVHTDQSGDSRVPRRIRVLTELVTGVQVIGSSDHNYNGSFDEDIDDLGLRGTVAAIDGNEVTADMLHANVFPAHPVTGALRGGASPYPEITPMSGVQFFAHVRALPDHPLIQLNHPRLRYAAYFDYAGWNGTSWPPPMPMDFDAFEVLQGMQAFNVDGDRRVDVAIQDLYTMVEHGKLATAVGNSDTHHLTGVLAGLPRNYVFMDKATLDPFDEDAFLQAIRDRRVLATTGPWLDVFTDDHAGTGGTTVPVDGAVTLYIDLREASYVHVNRIRVWVGGQVAMTLPVDPNERRYSWVGPVPVGTSDTWIGVDAMGDEPLPEPLTGAFVANVNMGHGMTPVALINPILVDADGDGSWVTPAAKAAGPMPVVDILPPPSTGQMMDCGQPPPAPLQ